MISVTIPKGDLSPTLQLLAWLQISQEEPKFDAALLAQMHRDLVNQIYERNPMKPSGGAVRMECGWEHVEVLQHIDEMIKKQRAEEKDATAKAQSKTTKATKAKAKGKKKATGI